MEVRKPGPANLRHHNATMGCLREEAGLPFRVAIHAYSVMDSYIYGFALLERTLPFETPEEYAEAVEARAKVIAEEHPSPADEYPHLFEIVAEFGTSGYDYNEEFGSRSRSDPRWDRTEAMRMHETVVYQLTASEGL